MTDETKPEAKIVSAKERSVTVQLDWPVEFDGVTYEAVTVRRVSGREVDAYVNALGASEGVTVKPPMLDVPQEVYDAMDDDDRLAVEEALLPFLPRRFHAAAQSMAEAAASTAAA